MPDTLFLAFEILGTVAFAISGALVAMEHKLDYFGILVLAVTTSIGGGLLRDIILNITPPIGLIHPAYVTTALITTALLLWLGRFRQLVSSGSPVALWSYYLSDALGLGVFTVTGVNTAIQAGYQSQIFLCIFVAMLTGVGGGMMRDILVHRIPVVLRKEIYAVASIIGALLYYFLRMWIPHSAAVLISVVATVGIRLLSLYFNIHMPSITSSDNREQK